MEQLAQEEIAGEDLPGPGDGWVDCQRGYVEVLMGVVVTVTKRLRAVKSATTGEIHKKRS